MMAGGKAYRFLALGAIAALGIAVVAAQQVTTNGPYTAAQANAGRAAYQANCAGCHQPDLRGQGEAPPLTGSNFMNSWGGRTSTELFDRIRTSMPANNPGS